jgi:hypothetical protein
MGVEFIRKSAKTFKKSWDWHRVSLATPTLFTQQPTCVARTIAADMASGASLQTGEAVTVQLSGTDLVAMRGLSEVAYFVDPPLDVVSAVQESYGVASGTIEQINNIAGIVEISIC